MSKAIIVPTLHPEPRASLICAAWKSDEIELVSQVEASLQAAYSIKHKIILCSQDANLN